MDSPAIRFNLLPLNPLKEIWLKVFTLLSGLEKYTCARKSIYIRSIPLIMVIDGYRVLVG